MLVALAVPIVAIAVGTLLALAGGAGPRVLVPVRSFALAAVLVAVLTHLLPEALEAIGPWAIAIFAAGFVAPALLGRLSRLGERGGRHARLAFELGFAGVVIHQVGDGLALGAFLGHWDVVIAIGVHTVPLAAAVALGSAPLHGRRGVIARAALLAIATLIGVIATGSGSDLVPTELAPWINAAVAGLLVHVLSHDLPTPPRTGTDPIIEVLAIAAGIALPLLVAHDDGGGAAGGEAVTATLRVLIQAIAVPLALGLVGTMVLELVAARPRDRLLAHDGVGPGLAAAVLASSCSCRAVARVRTAPRRTQVAFLLAAPELALETILIGAQLFGPQTAAIRAVAGVVIAGIAASVVGRGGGRKHEHEQAHEHEHEQAHEHEHEHERRHDGRGRGGHDRARGRDGHEHDERGHDGHGHDERRPGALARIDELIIHSGPWIAVGLITAAVASAALVPSYAEVALPISYAVAIAIGIVAYVCAPAATPAAFVVTVWGVATGPVIAGLLVGAATNRAIRTSLGTRAAVTIAAIAIPIAIAAGVAIDRVASPTEPILPFTGAAMYAACAVLGIIVLRGLWRYGLAAWLEPLHPGDHRHHQHGAGAPCGEGCHDH